MEAFDFVIAMQRSDVKKRGVAIRVFVTHTCPIVFQLWGRGIGSLCFGRVGV